MQKSAKKLFSILISISVIIGILYSPISISADDDENVRNFDYTTGNSITNTKLDSGLNRLLASTQGEKLVATGSEADWLNSMLIDGNQVRVEIVCKDGKEDQVLEYVQSLCNVEVTADNYIQAVVPLSNLEALTEANGLRIIREPLMPVETEITSEGVSLIEADTWQEEGFTGDGLKIAILDGGFYGYQNRITSGELPSDVITHWSSYYGGPGTSEHGTACAEIIYDIAPDATLYLVNIATYTEFANAVDWLITQNVDIISHSMGWFNSGPGDGTGEVCEKVDDAKDAGILWVNSAGNHAWMHWSGTFTDSDSDGVLNFSGSDESNAISVSTLSYPVIIYLKWDDDWDDSSNNYNLYLYNSSQSVVASSEGTQNGGDEPTESIYYAPSTTGTYHIVIQKSGSPSNVNFDLFTVYHTLQYYVEESSLLAPADSPNALTVGAVQYSNPNTIRYYSSQGPTNGDLTKPDLVAPDGVSTEAYGTKNFAGTSAACPHTAGAAALVKQAHPDFTPAEIQEYLEDNAVDLGDSGKDNVFGSGRLLLGDYNNAPVLSAGSLSETAGDMDDEFTYYVTYTDDDDDAPDSITVTVDSASTYNMTVKSGQDGDYTNGEIYEYTVSGLDAGDHTYQFAAEDTYESATGDTASNEGPYVLDGLWQYQDIDTAGNDGRSQLTIGNTDAVYVAYESSDAIGFATWDGENLDKDTIYSADVSAEYPAVALDSNALPHVTFIDNTDLMYTKWNGTNWSAPVVVYDNADASSSISIDLDSNDYPWICFADNTDFLSVSKWNGTAWQLENVSQYGMNPSLKIGSGDNAFISYFDSSVNKLNLAAYSGSSWSSQNADSDGNTGETSALSLDNSNNPYISYYDGGNGDLKYAVKSTDWNLTTVDADSCGKYSSISLDSSGYPHISYYQTGGGLKYAYYDGSGWIVSSVDTDGNTGKYTSIGLDSSDLPRISYYNADDNKIELAYFITGNAPSLSGGSVSPTSGDTSDSYTYTVVYTDANDDPPDSISVVIDGTDTYSMSLSSGTDGDYTNGEEYYYTISGSTLGTGSHTFKFTASDSLFSASDTSSHSGPTVTAVDDSSSGGSSGGGGGGGSSKLYLRLTGLDAGILDVVVDSLGIVQETVTCTSEDGNVSLYITEDTSILQSNGNLPSYLSVTALSDDIPEPPDDGAIICAYQFKQDGLVFDPYVTLTMKYDASALPEGADDGKIYLAYWDGEQWVKLECTIDEETQTVTANITHFSVYGLMAEIPVKTPATFGISNLNIDPAEAKTGEEIIITVNVENSGETSGSYPLTLTINGEEVENKSVMLSDGIKETVKFKVTELEAGTYSVEINGLSGTFTVVEAIAPPPEEQPFVELDQGDQTAVEETPAVSGEETMTEEKSSGFSPWYVVWGILFLIVCGITYKVVQVRRGQSGE